MINNDSQTSLSDVIVRKIQIEDRIIRATDSSVKNCKYIIVRQETFLKSEADQVVRYAQRSGYALKRVIARVCHVVLDINAIEVGQLTADFLERKTSWIPIQL